ncbi:hypothetical protein SAMN04487983_101580 [Streptomyces sp. yr375]|uniref:hypothetical protein n=1 Tax=Streptomyces sp. yr375 TaxID=1761906 RepID=UPI0008C0D03D|nr:hypothetical protein [Streptomyces sp. yr375]SER37346.1 hypothetical protein SAMN04487983_101580 [Streptomyces sp. yr375]
MATVSATLANNVTVQPVGGTSSTGLGSSFNVGSLAPVEDLPLSSPGAPGLTVDIQVENPKGTANTLTATVEDTSGSGAFIGQGTITWADGDSGVAWIEFTNFPLQGDQVTPTDRCKLTLQTSGDDVSVRWFTI